MNKLVYDRLHETIKKFKYATTPTTPLPNRDDMPQTSGPSKVDDNKFDTNYKDVMDDVKQKELPIEPAVINYIKGNSMFLQETPTTPETPTPPSKPASPSAPVNPKKNN